MLATNANTSLLPKDEESTPVDSTFKVQGKLVTVHSDPKVGQLGIVILSASGTPQQFFATNANNAAKIADVVRKFLGINKVQLQTGLVVSVTPIVNTNLVSVVLEHAAEGELPPNYSHVFGQYALAELDTDAAVKTHIHKGTVDDLTVTESAQ